MFTYYTNPRKGVYESFRVNRSMAESAEFKIFPILKQFISDLVTDTIIETFTKPFVNRAVIYTFVA